MADRRKARESPHSPLGGAIRGEDLGQRLLRAAKVSPWTSPTRITALTSGAARADPQEGGGRVKCENPRAARCPYAVGDVLTTSSPTPPAERWPGTTWQQIKDCFLLAAGDKYAIGSTGGEEAHALTGPEGARHVHNWVGWALRNNGWGTGNYTGLGGFKGDSWDIVSGGGIDYVGGSGIDYAGEGKPHNNMPPYQVFYFWERIA